METARRPIGNHVMMLSDLTYEMLSHFILGLSMSCKLGERPRSKNKIFVCMKFLKLNVVSLERVFPRGHDFTIRIFLKVDIDLENDLHMTPSETPDGGT